MGREANVTVGVTIPDFVGNNDLYEALDEAAECLEKKHIDVHDLAVDGLAKPPTINPKES